MTDQAQSAPKTLEPDHMSPLPWFVDCDGYIRAADRSRVAEAMLIADENYIVTACNSYPVLVAALQNIEALICDKPLCGHFTAEEIRAEVHAALREAGVTEETEK